MTRLMLLQANLDITKFYYMGIQLTKHTDVTGAICKGINSIVCLPGMTSFCSAKLLKFSDENMDLLSDNGLQSRRWFVAVVCND